MANTEHISEEIRNNLVKRCSGLGDRFSKTTAKPTEGRLAETFSVWALTNFDESPKEATFSEIVTDLELWHGQIEVDRQDFWSVRFCCQEDQVQLMRVMGQDYGSKVSHGIDLVDKKFPGECIVRMLEVPGYFIDSFWMHDAINSEDYFLIFNAPYGQRLQEWETYRYDVFLEGLRKEGPAYGIKF